MSAVKLPRHCIVWAFCAAATVCEAAAPAAAPNGYTLLRSCLQAESWIEGREKPTDIALYCFGLVSGVRTMNTAYRNTISAHQVQMQSAFCDPPSASTKQLIQVIVKYLRAHPNSFQKDATVLTVAALSESFPCQ